MYDPTKKRKLKGDPPRLEVETEPDEIEEIRDTGTCRCLGINFQGNMSWYSHLETGEKTLLPSIRKQQGEMKHFGNKIPKSCLKKSPCKWFNSE